MSKNNNQFSISVKLYNYKYIKVTVQSTENASPVSTISDPTTALNTKASKMDLLW